MMKAKHFKKLRQKVRWYDVEESDSMFGFSQNDRWSGGPFKHFRRVLAKNAVNACRRAVRRGYGLDHADCSFSHRDTSTFAHFRVRQSGKSNHFRNIIYIG